MNELEFRKNCMINPHSPDPRFQEALNDPDYQEIWKEYCDFDDKLRAAINLPISPNIKALLDIPNQASNDDNISWWRGAMQHPILSAAASFFVAITVTFGILLQPTPALSDAMIAHLYDHMDVMHLRTPANDQKFGDLLEHFGANSSIQIAHLHHVSLCEIGNHDGLHLVFDGETGPVTVFYVPDQQIEHLEMIAKDQFHGVMFPTGTGTMAIIGTMNEDVMKIKSEMEGKFIWVNSSGNGAAKPAAT